MKYIMLETKDGAKLPIIFPDVLTHLFVAGAMKLVLDTLDPTKDLRPKQLASMNDNPNSRVISAGFVSVIEAETFGESESLGVHSNKFDGGRMMFGQAVMHMPDETVEATLKLLAEKKKE